MDDQGIEVSYESFVGYMEARKITKTVRTEEANMRAAGKALTIAEMNLYSARADSARAEARYLMARAREYDARAGEMRQQLSYNEQDDNGTSEP